MVKLFKLFFRAEGTKPVLVLLALLLAAICEAVGITAVLPAVSIVAGGAGSVNASPMSGGVEAVFAWAGLEPSLGIVLALVAVALVLKAVISFVTLTYAGMAAAGVSVRLRQRLIDALFRADWRFYSGQESGKFASAISGEAARAGDAYLLAAQYAALAIQSVLYVAVTFFVDWRLAVVGLLVGAAMTRSLHFLVVRTKRAGRKQSNATENLTIKTVELLANIKPLKTMHRYASFQLAIRDAMRRLQRSLARREVLKQILTQSGDLITALALMAVIYVSFTVFHISLGSLVVSGLLFLKVVGNVTKLQKLRQLFAQAESAYDGMLSLIELTEKNSEPAAGRTAPDTSAEFQFEHVSFAYGTEPVLRDVSLTIPARCVTVLKGLSGSGKTTLIDLLIGLHRPQSGEVRLGGVPIGEIDVLALRRRIGYVSQELSLLHTSIRENILLGDASASEEDLQEAIRLAGLEELIASLPEGADTNVGEMGSRISGGQRQRIALARALVTKPRILILDEVTSALDPVTEAGIVGNIRALAKDLTIIVITHREAWVDVAERLYEVSAGRVREIGRAAA